MIILNLQWPGASHDQIDAAFCIRGQKRGTGSPPFLPPTEAIIIDFLKKLADKFEALIAAGTREEDLQTFWKDNPSILHPSAESFPKKKLGEDFVTDFVLVATATQGPTYTLVELERSSHPVLTKDCVLSGPVNHALKQIRDWGVWQEKNKVYVQNTLPGFETPKYLVVIGRGNQLNDEERAHLRSHNRDWKNTSLLTYEDVLETFRSTVTNFEGLVTTRANQPTEHIGSRGTKTDT